MKPLKGLAAILMASSALVAARPAPAASGCYAVQSTAGRELCVMDSYSVDLPYFVTAVGGYRDRIFLGRMAYYMMLILKTSAKTSAKSNSKDAEFFGSMPEDIGE